MNTWRRAQSVENRSFSFIIYVHTSEGKLFNGTPKFISNIAGVVSSDIFNVIIHYKCVLVSGGPPVCHCLVSLVLLSINIQCVTILHPGDISSRRGCGGAGEGQVCGGPGTLETGNIGCSCKHDDKW